jgi:hypothetical protein
LTKIRKTGRRKMHPSQQKPSEIAAVAAISEGKGRL